MKTVISNEDGVVGTNYSVSLPFELKAGRYALIRWKATSTKGISFNFAEGNFFDSKVLLHYNPRFQSKLVVRNAKDGSWGKEETDGGMPFQVGVTSEIKLVVRSDFFECFADGVKHAEFKHRLPVNLAKFFFVGGEGEIYSVIFGDEADDQAAAECKKDLTIPYSTPCDIFPGRKIYVSGTPLADGKKFRVILKADEDYAFSFAARLDEKVIVMNTKIGGDWKNRADVEGFPFQPGQFFNILIQVETDKFKVSVNDQPFIEFQHRILPLTKINSLVVDREVKLCCADVL